MGNSHIKLSDWIFASAPAGGLALPDAVIAYWKMDETSGSCLDSVGTYPLVENAATTVTEDGLFSNARSGFSSTAYLYVNGANILDDFRAGSSKFYAYDLFFKVWQSTTAASQTIAAIDDTYQTLAYDSDAAFRLQASDSSSAANKVADAGTADYSTSWNHVLVAKIGEGTVGTFLLIINGVLVDSATGYNFAYPRGFTVGRNNRYSTGAAADIKICDMAWWNNLTADNVPGTGTLTERLTAIALLRYNDGVGQQYIV